MRKEYESALEKITENDSVEEVQEMVEKLGRFIICGAEKKKGDL